MIQICSFRKATEVNNITVVLPENLMGMLARMMLILPMEQSSSSEHNALYNGA